MTTLTRTQAEKRSGPAAAAWLAEYDRNGYVILPQAFSADQIATLNAETLKLVRGELGDIEGSIVGPDMSDPEALASTIAVHFPHKRSAVFTDALRHPAIVEALIAIIGPDVKLMQSIVFVKSEGKPGQAWHQDENFIPTRDHSLTAAWIALDDATVQNGCLWVHPRSHSSGVLYPDREQDDAQFDCSSEAFNFSFRDDEARPMEIRAGDVLLFDGYLLHRSMPNYGGLGLRRSLVNHYMSSTSLLPWEYQEGVWMAETDFRDIVPIAGVDHYAWRGITSQSVAHVRPAREGGCKR